MISNPHFFIFGYFGWSNFGDDSICLSIIKKLKHLHPNASFTITYNDRSSIKKFIETNNLGDINTINFNKLNIILEIGKSDYFLIAGGTHIHDEDQLKLRRCRLLFSFVMLTSLARIMGKSPTLIGHGVGPLTTRWSKVLSKIIFNNINKIFVRDPDSYYLVSSLGYKSKCILGFDCAAALVEDKILEATNSNSAETKQIIGISLLPAFQIYSDDEKKDDEILSSFAKCLRQSLQRQSDSTELRLFAFRTGVNHSDTNILTKLIKKLDLQSKNIDLVLYTGDIERFIKSIHECDAFIGMRYHASLFAYLLNKPQLIINYMNKCGSLGKDIAISNNAIIPYIEIIKPEFQNEVQSFLSNPENYIAGLPLTTAISRMQMMFETLGDEL